MVLTWFPRCCAVTESALALVPALAVRARALLDGLDQCHAFALPVTGPHHHNLVRGISLFNLEPA